MRGRCYFCSLPMEVDDRPPFWGGPKAVRHVTQECAFSSVRSRPTDSTPGEPT